MTDQAEQLREIMRSRNENGDVNSRTRVIAVSSGKGGVGKTNMSINIAIAYAQLGKKVLVMDADLGLANVNVAMGIIPKYNLYHLIRQKKKMQDIIINTDFGIQIVAGASGFSKIANLSDEERENFIGEISSMDAVDIIVIDTSAGVSSNVLDFIAAADDAIIVTTPEPTAITDAYGIIKIIATEIDNMNLGLKLIVNRVKSVTEGKKVAERVINIASQFLNLKVDYLGYVYDDPQVSQAILKQKPFMIIDPNCKASICIKHIVSRLEKVEYKEGGGLKKFLNRLVGK
ncbi:MAG: MinD/ParA family protein [Spirochaetales bacterium]|nr:MinD/ParA family protein [Spirochaetales bacterium]